MKEVFIFTNYNIRLTNKTDNLTENTGKLKKIWKLKQKYLFNRIKKDKCIILKLILLK